MSLVLVARVLLATFLPSALALVVGCVGTAPTPTGEGGATPSTGTLEVTVQEGTSMAAALSPDGRTIVIDAQGSLWTLPATGGRATRITDEFYDARQPAWSPDGKRIAFQGFRSGDWDIWVVAADGRDARALTSGPFDDREPHWSPDGQSVAFSSDRSGNYDIWQVHPETRAVRQITKTPSDDFFPAWSPGGREIAYASNRSDSPGIYAATENGVERQLARAEGNLGAPSWSPDGQQILYSVSARGESRLMLGDQALGSGEDVFPFRAQWTSATEFLYTADGRIKRREVGGAPRVVDFSVTFTLDRPAYPRRPRDFDAAGARPVRGIVHPVSSPDGKEIAFAALGDIWIQTVGGEAKRITDDRFLDTDPHWSPDGRSLAFSSDRAGGMDLWVHEFRTGAARRLTDLPSSDLQGAWSPDGGRIAFVAIDSNFAGEIYTVDVRTRAVRKVHDRVFGPSDPAWSPDGRRIMIATLKPYSGRFREGINQFVTFPSDGGPDTAFTVTPHRGSDVRAGGGPVWSPDGRRIAFVMEGALTVMDVTAAGEPNGPPRRITDEIAHSPSWTGDSQQVVYLSSDRLRRVPADGGTATDLGLNLTYSPRMPVGQFVVHAGRLVDGRNVPARTDVDIVVEGHRIKAIEPHSPAHHAGTVVDASTLTVMPGLIEMHGHLVKEYGERMGRAWLSYGITTVRNPAAMTPYMSLEDREAVEAGTRPGPRIYASGYQMDGSRIYYPMGLSVSSEAQLEWELDRTKRLDLDFIKTYVRLPDHFQRRVIEYAHSAGLPVTSHEIYPAVGMGADATEHTSGTSRRGYSPKISQTQVAYADVVQLIARSGMAFTPTATLGAGFQNIARRDPNLLADPRYRGLFPAWIVSPSRPGGGRGGGFGGGVEPRGARMAHAILRAGGIVLAGTDSPLAPYGVSLQAELQMLVEGGFTPLQALQTATLTAAAALNASRDLGSVEAGKLADFVMVEGDPLADITNARKVRKVVKNGELFDVETLVGPAPSQTETAELKR
jgi:Tol biopolymer transport system component